MLCLVFDCCFYFKDAIVANYNLETENEIDFNYDVHKDCDGLYLSIQEQKEKKINNNTEKNNKIVDNQENEAMLKIETTALNVAEKEE